ncbi:EscC/YscC/HrcC family type III secretion system outer membrane ring protein [Enterobacteriaceae bacterium H20N1]|uniref:Type 3 secretion system secretin n=1 Tax=Dryocola boscaweniae TaxID=2925397 RepID=A0A9X3AME8_9ENTR|nr:EscC/YscC/HrcC family type III secretion system outer membrane ring protein [Dryocola boscaweniae]MCT4700506.1 EscC/YscC/HrcC family type III secretion system outer membrane ring protein [Dryocola boscaweniae]MCT4717662.1 EscC/YscC/HrcC family type III secretion system outer membrane ring protein [Dryocola boscaweniae]
MKLRLSGALLLACLIPLQQGYGAEPRWQGEPFFIHTRGMPANALLRDLGANYHVPVIVSDLVNDVFVGEINGDGPQQSLARLERLFNLVSWYDGQALHVYKAREVASTVVTSQYLQPQALRSYLNQSGVLSDAGCRLRQVADFQAFEVQGVPACIQRVSQLVQEVDSKARIRATNTEALRVIPLRFASASDITYQYREQQVVVPGVVSVLNQMRSGKTLPVGDDKGIETRESITTQFSADPSQNAVIVRARELDIPLYQQLIAQLDKRQHQIEISVAIIDVDIGNLRQLGLDWGGTVGGGGFSVGFNSGISGDSSNYMSSVVSDSSDFMARVSALQQNSKARVLSQPSVVTQNNVQAILDKNVTFYTKLEGENVAKLESVTSGTLMRVTPRIVEDSQGRGIIQQIMLQLNIQDGQQSGVTSQTEPLPQVQNSEITTQATLNPGQSLLLGGFVQDKQIESKRGIPLLGDIPLLGELFSTTHHETHSVVRLFLIKAQPISLGG